MSKQAFVAMKFVADPWRDKTYMAIREVLEESGYECLRADEIRTSGPSVDEVCRLLKEAALVVIDSSGDSHNVSYEVGYCHGISRPADSTILLKNSDTLPFNYKHYRHLVYRDTRHLRRLLRGYLNIIEPIRLDALGYSFAFSFSDDIGFGYILSGASCVFDALRELQYSGRCECYAAEMFAFGRMFVVGLMLRPSNRQAEPTGDFWERLYIFAERNVKIRAPKLELLRDLSEFSTKRGMLSTLVPCGVAEYQKGIITRILGTEDETFFRSYLTRQSDEADSSL
ncbi:MAG TPA: hypothetical protein VK363_00025 [Pyrinomonadaceae bacterium]|nr:hypothetical protein [Pyrinomonadaceae bacterium]